MNQIAISELAAKGRVYVTYREALRTGVAEAVRAWMAFCALPPELKQRFDYTKDHKVSGNGYELKLDGIFDRKEDFHLRVSARDWLLEQADLVDGEHSSVTREFVEKALAVNELMRDTLYDFALAVETHYGIKGFADDVMARKPSWLLRFLHYFGERVPGDEFAAPHVDKGGFTLHLYESHDGVEMLDFDTKIWEPLPLSHDQTVIFAGMGLQHRAECTLRALCHRVMANEETAGAGRYSAVAFIGFEHSMYWDKDTFGRMQDYAPGAFYDMPFGDFTTYFIE